MNRTIFGSSLTQRAFLFALNAHAGQTRKYTGEPYICHPYDVAMLVARHGGDEEEIAAAILHDTVEDCGVTEEQLTEAFTQRVANLVLAVSDVSKPEDGNRQRRKEIDRLHLSRASNSGKSIKLADLISNTSSIVAHDPDFARVYLHEKRALMDVLVGGHPSLYALAFQSLVEATETLHAE